MHRRPHRVPLVAVVVLSTLLAAACTVDLDEVRPGTPRHVGSPAAAAVPATGVLYVQRSGAGRAHLDADGAGTLVLTRVDPDTVWFQDRPDRDAGRMTTAQFVDRWASAGFDADPPNATLEVTDADGVSSNHVVELRHPRWDPATRTLTYSVKVDEGGGAAPPAEFAAASLFIDNGGSSYQRITFEVSNVQPGQAVKIGLTANGVGVALSSGPDLLNAGGIQVNAPTGVLPASQLQVQPSELVVLTSPVGGVGTVQLEAQLYLVADPGIETFYLRSMSDPGVEVTAQVGNDVPQVVNQTQTLFAWLPL